MIIASARGRSETYIVRADGAILRCEPVGGVAMDPSGTFFS